jgi:transglutaminase-like putative cysteine protease
MAADAHRKGRSSASAGGCRLEKGLGMNSLARKLLPSVFNRAMLMLALTLAALVCLPSGLSWLVNGAATEAFAKPLMVGAALLAWLLAATGWKSRFWPFLLFGGGFLGLFIIVGQLDTALLTCLRAVWALLPQLWSWLADKIAPDATQTLLSLNLLGLRTWALLVRLSDWLNAFFSGRTSIDQLASNLVWSVLLWLAAAWAGWQIRRHRAVLTGLFPTTLTLALVLDATGKQKEIFLLHLGALVILLGLVNYDQLLVAWHKRALDYAESIHFDTVFATFLVATCLVLGATLLSSFSVREILDRLRERPAAPAGQVASDSTPVSIPTPQKTDLPKGPPAGVDLPNRHLLGSGPELSSLPVMTIATGDLAPMPLQAHPNPPRYYWRTLTYATYTGAGWENAFGDDNFLPPGNTLTSSAPAAYRPVTQLVTFSGQPSTRLFWTGVLVRADVPLGVVWRAGMGPGAADSEAASGAEIVSALAQAASYQAESLVPQVSVAELRQAPATYPAWVRETYLTLPASVPQRVRDLASSVTRGQSTPYDRAKAIETYLRQFPYTLEISAPPPGRDVADYFLFDLQKGYCDYYATALVVLARANGLPARLVAGYASGYYDAPAAVYRVTQADAHAWAEIYFSGLGWVEFEPTAGQPELIRPGGAAAVPALAPQKRPGGWTNVPAAAQTALAWLVLGLPLALLPLAGWLLYTGWIEPRRSPERSLRRTYQRLRRRGSRFTGALPPSQTAWEFAEALTAQLAARPRTWTNQTIDDLQKLTGLYTRMLFAPTRAQAAEALAAAHLLRQIAWRLAFLRPAKP